VKNLRLDGKVTQAERDRRRRENLCLYCGGKGHVAQDCKKKPANTSRQAAATSTAASEPSKEKIEGSSDASVHGQSCVDSECTNEVHLNASALSVLDALYLPICIASSPDMLSLTMNSCVANTLVDSGSDRCFVDPMFLNKFDFSPYSVGLFWLRYLDGSYSSITPKALNCTLVSPLEKSSRRNS
jgi:hypothetical protein